MKKRCIATLISLISSAAISVNGCFYSEQVKPIERAERVRDTANIQDIKPEIAQISFDKPYNIYLRKDGGFLEVLYDVIYVDCRMTREKKLQYWFVHREGKSHLIKIWLDDIYRIEEAERR